MTTLTGSCLCGASKMTVKGAPMDGNDCQLTSGSAFSSNVLAKEADVEFEGKIGRYTSKAASGNDVTRIFCTACGCPFAHNSNVFGDSIAVQTASLGKYKDVPFQAELFVKDRWTGVEAVKGADQQQTA
ncbi:hypothetical protein JCM6882_002521 [Rhodosporidiobolus microsporus]